jgi:integration host factor subunit alpha
MVCNNNSNQKGITLTNMAITKSNLIETISARLDLSPLEAKELLENLLETIKSTLASGEDLMVSGFGRFQVNDNGICQ